MRELMLVRALPEAEARILLWETYPMLPVNTQEQSLAS